MEPLAVGELPAVRGWSGSSPRTAGARPPSSPETDSGATDDDGRSRPVPFLLPPGRTDEAARPVSGPGHLRRSRSARLPLAGARPVPVAVPAAPGAERARRPAGAGRRLVAGLAGTAGRRPGRDALVHAAGAAPRPRRDRHRLRPARHSGRRGAGRHGRPRRARLPAGPPGPPPATGCCCSGRPSPTTGRSASALRRTPGSSCCAATRPPSPAATAILESLPAGTRARVWLEVPHAGDIQDVRTEADAEITWLVRHDGAPMAVDAVRAAELPGTERAYVWLAGESGQVKALRRHFVGERGVDRRRVTFVGYWRQGHDGGAAPGRGVSRARRPPVTPVTGEVCPCPIQVRLGLPKLIPHGPSPRRTPTCARTCSMASPRSTTAAP